MKTIADIENGISIARMRIRFGIPGAAEELKELEQELAAFHSADLSPTQSDDQTRTPYAPRDLQLDRPIWN